MASGVFRICQGGSGTKAYLSVSYPSEALCHRRALTSSKSFPGLIPPWPTYPADFFAAALDLMEQSRDDERVGGRYGRQQLPADLGTELPGVGLQVRQLQTDRANSFSFAIRQARKFSCTSILKALDLNHGVFLHHVCLHDAATEICLKSLVHHAKTQLCL